MFRDGRRHGDGIYFFKALGKKIKGMWENDRFVGGTGGHADVVAGKFGVLWKIVSK